MLWLFWLVREEKRFFLFKKRGFLHSCIECYLQGMQVGFGNSMTETKPLVSVIIPCHNGMPWIDECLASCATQDYDGPLEVSIFDDSSTDGSDVCIRSWAVRLQDAGITCVCSGNRWPESVGSDPAAPAGGAGRARNKAVAQVARHDSNSVFTLRRPVVMTALTAMARRVPVLFYAS